MFGYGGLVGALELQCCCLTTLRLLMKLDGVQGGETGLPYRSVKSLYLISHVAFVT